MQIGWHGISRLFLKNFQFSTKRTRILVGFIIYYLVLVVNSMGRILVRWKGIENHLEIQCHPICNRLYNVSHLVRHSEWDTLCATLCVRHSMWDTLCKTHCVRHSICDTHCARHSMWDTLCATLYVRHSMWDTLCETPCVRHSMWDTKCATL